MRRLWAGFYEVPPFFLFALLPKGGPVGASLGGCRPSYFYATYSLTRRSQQDMR
jgi:hypothetical protein